MSKVWFQGRAINHFQKLLTFEAVQANISNAQEETEKQQKNSSLDLKSVFGEKKYLILGRPFL